MGRHDWYRRSTWTADDQREFRSRLARSRGRSSKSQCLRIQALYLADADPPLLNTALDLLDEFLRDYAEEIWQLALVHGQRGSCFAGLGQYEQALAALRESLAVERRFPNVKTDAYLDFAELVLELKRRDLYDEAVAELGTREADAVFPIQQYRLAASIAFLSEALGRLEIAREAAVRAIDAASKTESPFRYHRRLGLVGEVNEDIQARLWRLAGRL